MQKLVTVREERYFFFYSEIVEQVAWIVSLPLILLKYTKAKKRLVLFLN